MFWAAKGQQNLINASFCNNRNVVVVERKNRNVVVVVGNNRNVMVVGNNRNLVVERKQ